MSEQRPGPGRDQLARQAAEQRAIAAEQRSGTAAQLAILAEARAQQAERQVFETRDELGAELRKTWGVVENTRQALHQAHQTLDQANEALRHTVRRAGAAEHLADLRRQHIENMEASLSWRITRPLRRLKQKLEALRGRPGRAPEPVETAAATGPAVEAAKPGEAAAPSIQAKDIGHPLHAEGGGQQPADSATVAAVPMHTPDSAGDEDTAAVLAENAGPLAAQAVDAEPAPPGKPALLIVGPGAAMRQGLETATLARLFSGQYHVVAWLQDGAPASAELRAHAAEILSESAGYAQAPGIADRLRARHDFAYALVNGIEARAVLPALSAAYMPVVSLVHDAPSHRISPYSFQEVIFWSNHTVFAARDTLEHARDAWPYLLPRAATTLPLPLIEATGTATPDESGGASTAGSTGTSSAAAGGLAEAPAARPPRFLASLPRASEGGPKRVVGTGPLAYGSGVDLFIDTAARVLARQPADERVHFIWLGQAASGAEHEAYAAHLAAQIRKAELGAHITLVTEAASLADVLPQADALLLTARGGTTPIDAVQALRAGIPVACFADATDLADLLGANALTSACVAPYLDTSALADILQALLAPGTERDTLISQGREAALRAFQPAEYTRTLDALGLRAHAETRQEQEDAGLILDSGLFLPQFVEAGHDGSTPLSLVARKYVRGWKTGLGMRKPRPGFHPAIYRAERLAQDSHADPFADYLRQGQPEGPWRYPVIGASAALAGPDAGPASPPMTGIDTRHAAGGAVNATGTAEHPQPRCALHIHAYYPELLAEILERMRANRLRPDLFVSVKDAASQERAGELLQSYEGRVADVAVVPNQGRDIGPFLTAFGQRLCDEYDLIGHIHTKQSLHVSDRAAIDGWRHFLLENMLGGNQGGAMADAIVSAMAADPGLGIVFPDDPTPLGWDYNRACAQALAPRLGIARLPEHFNFPTGTMFWIRASVLRPFVDLALEWDDYPTEPLGTDGSMLHALERLFGIAPAAHGLRSAVTWVDGVTR